MNPLVVAIIALIIGFVLIFLRMPIAFAFALSGFLGMWYLKGLEPALSALATIPYATSIKYTWTVMPLFLLLGFLAFETKMAAEFYEGTRKWIGQFRGGLANAVIVGNTAFGAVCGDLIASAVTFALISLPEMRKYKYSDSLTLGAVAAGSFLSLLIPPSLGFVIYGAITQTSVGALFIAGIFPGLLLTVLYIGVIYIWCRIRPEAGPPGPKTTWAEKLRATPGMWALVMTFIIIIGGLYLGIFTPTEAGAVGAFVVLVLGILRRKLSWQGLKNAVLDTGLGTAMIMFLIFGVMIFNLLLVMTGLPVAIAQFVVSVSGNSAFIALILIAVVYFILGCFIDATALIILTVPIFFPTITNLGISPILFGFVAIMTLGIGAVTPPYGMAVYAVSGVVKDVPLFRIFKGAVPFLIAMIICELLVILFPQICEWLPSTMGSGL